jgi:hypothetical protein
MWRLSTFILLSLAMAAIDGCGRKPATIVGTWQGTASSPFGAAPVTLVFKPDGTMTETYNNDQYTGKYTINGNQLRMDIKTVAGNGAGEIDETDAFLLNGDELTIETFAMSQNSCTFTRQ